LVYGKSAFNVDLPDLLDAPKRLRSVYFHDPDGNLLELLSMLPDEPRPELGVMGWRRWKGC